MSDRGPAARLEEGFLLEDRVVLPSAGSVVHKGCETVLQPKVMEVLLYLSERAGRVVSREELFAAVWSGSAVDQGVLTRCVHRIRRALGDDHRRPRFVQTVPKRGYRLLVSPAPLAVRLPQRRMALAWLTGGALALGLGAIWVIGPALGREEIVTAGTPVVTVLPFSALGLEAADARLSAGITEEVITQMSRVDGLRVTRPERSTGRPGGSGGDGRAGSPGTSAFLTGSVRRDGGRVRITAMLTDPSSEENLWAEVYDRRIDDLPTVQREVAVRIAAALESELTRRADRDRGSGGREGGLGASPPGRQARELPKPLDTGARTRGCFSRMPWTSMTIPSLPMP